MNKYLASAALASAFVLPVAAQAKPVTFSTTMSNYGGPEAYMVMYVTDASGAYQGSLWMSGGRSKYYRDLRDWSRATGWQLSRSGWHHRCKRWERAYAECDAGLVRCPV